MMQEDEVELLRDLETRLMQQLDERILQAEEKEMIDRYNKLIRTAEQREGLTVVLNDDDDEDALLYRFCMDASDDAVTTRPRKRLDAALFAFQGLDPHSVHGMQYVRATLLIPRFLSGHAGKSRQELAQSIERKFRKDCASLLQPVHWAGFRLQLQSANPNSWRLVVMGYEKTANLLRLALKRWLRKHLMDLKAPPR